MYYAGIDLGSITAKAVIIGNGQILASTITFSGYNSAETARRVLAEALEKAGLTHDDVARLVATGYGRIRVPAADKQITEITCHARGAYWLHPDTRTIIDVGGQDSKGIALNDHGKVVRELTKQEYQHLQTLEVRGFSGHWILFSILPVTFFKYLYGPMKSAAEAAKNENKIPET